MSSQGYMFEALCGGGTGPVITTDPAAVSIREAIDQAMQLAKEKALAEERSLQRAYRKGREDAKAEKEPENYLWYKGGTWEIRFRRGKPLVFQDRRDSVYAHLALLLSSPHKP